MSSMLRSGSTAVVASLALVVTACGSGDRMGVGDAGAPRDAGRGSTDGGGSTDASGDTGAADAGGGGDEGIYPLSVGRTWTFEVAAVGAGSVCAAGTHSDEVLAEVTVDGRGALEVRSWCSAAGTSTLYREGDRVESRYMDGWIVVLDTPVEEGHTWTSTGPIRYTWRREGSVTVPAGTYDDCWRREQQVAYTAYTIFCRGVGPVRDYSEDLSGAGWDARLTARGP